MEFRYMTNPKDGKTYDTERLRQEYHVSDLFSPGKLKSVYVHEDRMIVGGVCPLDSLQLEGEKGLGAAFFLERREMGIINIGGSGSIRVDGKEYVLETFDGMYLGLGVQEVVFNSKNSKEPAKYYFNSTTAHTAYPTKKIDFNSLKPGEYGGLDSSSKRRIYQFISPGNVESCQLTLGFTSLEENCVWNTMPCHLHDRRMEVYFYFDMSPDDAVFHFMGEPHETRHIVVRNEEAVLSPSWSIHSGCGTKRYSFIWGMGGENKIVTDVEALPMEFLK